MSSDKNSSEIAPESLMPDHEIVGNEVVAEDHQEHCEHHDHHVQPVSLEIAALEAAVADGLLTHTAMKADTKPRKMGLRRGKWTIEEENYANRLISEFKLGLLPLTDGTTLRTFLSKLLNCDPMRISKKFVGAKCIGKQVFRRRQSDLEKMSPAEIEACRSELAELEKLFLDRVAQISKAKPNGNANVTGGNPDSINCGAPYDGIEQQARWMMSQQFNGDRMYANGVKEEGPMRIPRNMRMFQHMYGPGGEILTQSDSTGDMIEFQRLMASSNDALTNMVGFNQDQPLAYEYMQRQQLLQYQDHYPRVSTLEVLCEGGSVEDSRQARTSKGERVNSFPWLNSPVVSNRRRVGVVPDDLEVRYSTLEEWPSMNNLVVAAETIEHMGSMNSLLGGGLMDSEGSLSALSSVMNTAMSELQPILLSNVPTGDYVSYYRNHRNTPPIANNSDQANKDITENVNAPRQQCAENNDDEDVGYPLEEDDSQQVQQQQQPHGLGLFHVNARVSSDTCGSPRDRASSLSSSRDSPGNANHVSMEHPHRTSPHLSGPLGSFGRKEAANINVISPRNTLPATAAANISHQNSNRPVSTSNHPMGKTSSVDNFWMLVDMGDLPQPDSDALSKTIWQGKPASPTVKTTKNKKKSSAASAAAVIRVATTGSSPRHLSSSQYGGTAMNTTTSHAVNEGESDVSSQQQRITPNLLPPHILTLTKHPRSPSFSEEAVGESTSSSSGHNEHSKNNSRDSIMQVENDVNTTIATAAMAIEEGGRDDHKRIKMEDTADQ